MSKISVELIDHMGSDLSVVNAARVSFDKESDWEWKHEFPLEDGPGITLPSLSEKDTKLIHYLAKHNHWSPFAHCFLSFRIKAPIFVARQLQKHQVGLAWNEVSRRYVDTEPEFYVPEGWRKRAENVKQGSSDELISYIKVLDLNGNNSPICDAYEVFAREAVLFYNRLLSKGVCPEQARMVLPQSMMTEWIWSGSLHAFMRVYKLRTDPHAQKETQEVALGIGKHILDKFPVSFHALNIN